MLNYFDILKNVCLLAHEAPPASFSVAQSPYNEIKQYINNILEEVCSKFYWTFRERVFYTSTLAGQKEYELPEGIAAGEILQNGIRIGGVAKPLYFMLHSDLDMLSESSGQPCRYTVYNGKLIFDPVPDDVYSVTIKYLTTNFAYNADKSLEKTRLQEETDVTIIPDRFIKVIEWGAYSLYRQNFKPDNKYKLARDKYIEFLLDMQKHDSHSGDASPMIIFGGTASPSQAIVRDFFSE